MVKAPELINLIAPNNDKLKLLAQKAADLGEKLLHVCIKMAAADDQFFNFGVPKTGRNSCRCSNFKEVDSEFRFRKADL